MQYSRLVRSLENRKTVDRDDGGGKYAGRKGMLRGPKNKTHPLCIGSLLGSPQTPRDFNKARAHRPPEAASHSGNGGMGIRQPAAQGMAFEQYPEALP